MTSGLTPDLKASQLGVRGTEQVWELEVSGVGSDKAPVTGTVQIISERGVWKLERDAF